MAISGSYNDLTNKPAAYTLPIATSTVLGGVKVGSGINVAGDGTISASSTIATATVLGSVKIGANVNVAGDGTISVAAPYSLPTASATTLGGIKVGANLSIDGNGVLSGGAPYSLPIASSSVLGGVKIGANVNVAGDGTISVAAPYSLPAATTTTRGGMIVGDNLTVDANGRVSASASYTLPPATTTTLGGVKVGSGLAVDGTGLLSLNYSSPVTSVNNRTGAVIVQIQSDNPKPGSVSLIGANGAANGTMTLHDLVAGSGMTVAPNTDGNIVLSSTSAVTSVSGQTGAVVVQAQDNNTSSGVSLISNSGSSTGIIKMLRLVAGNNITLGPDGNGNLQVNGPNAYTLAPATASVLGGVKIGANVNVTADGTISVAAPTAPYTLPPATTTTLGGVIVGSGLTVDGTGKISVSAPPVTSVNGQIGAVTVSATNTVTGNTSLITDSGATTGVMKFKQVKAGTNVTISDDGAGTLTFNSSATSAVSSVNGQTGAVTVSATNAVTGNTSLITDSGATTGIMKFKQVKAGSNVTINDDGAGTLTVNSTASSGFSTVADVASSRAYGPTYTAPVTTFVCVTTTILAQGIITAKVNGITVGSAQVPSGGSTTTIPISFMVPSGATYSVTMNNPAYGAGVTWTETS